MKTLILIIVSTLLLVLVACGSKVDEEASGTVIGKIGTSELGPGKSADVTLDLAPGKYALICNVSGHYEDGMYASFEVTAGDASKSGPVGVRLGEWWVNSDRATAATGPITFEVTNRGGSDHDFVVIKTDLAPAALVLK